MCSFLGNDDRLPLVTYKQTGNHGEREPEGECIALYSV